ncbi:MAG: alkylation response protein AidB-like acyl-CoA dehydrogenase [Candidatus Pseudothioglobus sp.]|jgi:alkylation response protein AidB-like acyl-CoA dehydrogenase
MADYKAPTRDMLFTLNHLAGLEAVCALPAFSESSPDLVASVLEEAAKFAADVLAPLNTVGDLIGTRVVGNQVREASGFGEAYLKFVEGGWPALPCNTTFGGMGLPECVGLATMEMWSAANLSFGLCPMLGQGAIEAIEFHASEALKARYLPKMISGDWTGTMNLTESQAGSDLSSVRTKAVVDGDHYRLYGTKIYITWGDHNMTNNVVHLVLARVEGAPEGVKGISLFLVPKFLLDDDGEPAERNDVFARSVEHKIGIHGSPTCVMAFGDTAGAVGYLVGEANMGLSYMFTMMNHARLNVGVQGVALSDRAYQQALSYARDRVQGQAPGQEGKSPIIHHPDVRRMLMTMRALSEASRALCYVTSAAFDYAHKAADADRRTAAMQRAELLTPLSKAWSTEISQEVTSIGVQVHGGMGYIEETGAAQLMRDARITTIYEGTTGIQANDLIGRKVIRDRGKGMTSLLADVDATLAELRATLPTMAEQLSAASNELREVTDFILTHHEDDPFLASTVSFHYLMGTGTVIAGWQMARAALIAKAQRDDDVAFYDAKLATAIFYMEQILPRSAAHFSTITLDATAMMALDMDQF